MALLLSFFFLVGLLIRARADGRTRQAPWPVPFVLGVAYFPLLFGAIPCLIWLTGQGQGALIGSSIMAVLLGLPVAFGQIVSRMSERFQWGSPSGRS